MKVILEFDFNNKRHDDKLEHERMLKATDLCACLWDFNQHLRNRIKYDGNLKTGYEELEDARTKLYELMNEHGIDLDKLFY